jgi:hypothetical protein
MLIPESIAISNALELLAGYGRSQLSEHRPFQLDLAEDTHVGIDVIDAVETFLDDEAIELVIENVLKVIQSFQSEGHPQGVVVCDTVVSIAIGIDGKKIEISAHDRRRNIPELVYII